MTTPAREALYEAQHRVEHEGRKNAVYNPHGKPIDELPVIYGFNNGGTRGFLQGALIAEDGTWLGGHICSDEAYMPADLGILEGTRADRHEGFRTHYPDGYRIEFVPYHEVLSHEKLMDAIRYSNEEEE